MDFFYVQKKCFSILFFGQNKEKLLRFMQQYFIALLIYMMVLSAVFIFQHMDDLMEAAETFGYFSSQISTLTKMITLYFFKERFDRLMEMLNKMSNEGLVA
jgi:hypothetical protein